MSDKQSNFDILSRRKFLQGSCLSLQALTVSACTTSDVTGFASAVPTEPRDVAFNYDVIYGPVTDSEINLPAFDYRKMNEKHLRRWVNYRRKEKPGTIVVDALEAQLYLVQPGGKAIRYGIATGKEGYAWYGDAVMKWKQKWPTWTPPPEMIARTPHLKEFEDGMPAGVQNPLGARALYLFKDGKDTLFRIHGTNRPYSIGKAASSGCFRMINQDVIDLYDRVTPGALVYVKRGISENPGDFV